MSILCSGIIINQELRHQVQKVVVQWFDGIKEEWREKGVDFKLNPNEFNLVTKGFR
jgi:hypothetical protein